MLAPFIRAAAEARANLKLASLSTWHGSIRFVTTDGGGNGSSVSTISPRLRTTRGDYGTQLMQAIEDAARRDGFGLLTLDAKRGEAGG
jgi:hypothetical protein